MQTSQQHHAGQPFLSRQCLAARQALSVREQLSVLVDGECETQDWDGLARAYGESSELEEVWAHYQCISAALRSPHRAGPVASPEFLARVMSAVALEAAPPSDPVVIAPAPLVVQPVAPTSWVAANDSIFRWKLLAGCASLAAVAAVAWQLVAAPATPVAGQWAQTPPPQTDTVQAVLTPSGAIMLRDAQLDELMAAHRQSGGMSALQVSTGFLRNATYQTSQP